VGRFLTVGVVWKGEKEEGRVWGGWEIFILQPGGCKRYKPYERRNHDAIQNLTESGGGLTTTQYGD
jgi:hypothetical protein